MLAGLVHDDDSKGNAVILQDRMHGIGRHGGRCLVQMTTAVCSTMDGPASDLR
jgi:hypothetical protein